MYTKKSDLFLYFFFTYVCNNKFERVYIVCRGICQIKTIGGIIMEKEILSMKQLLEYHNQYIEAQNDLKLKGFYFCPECGLIRKIENKHKTRDYCDKCWKKLEVIRNTEYRKRKQQEMKKLKAL